MRVLDEYEALEFFADHNIPVVPTVLATDLTAALKAASEIGYPVVLKLSSPELTHKSESGAVMLGISSDAELEAAWNAMQDKAAGMGLEGPRLRGMLVQKMIQGGTEFIIGGTRDASFGPTIMFGMGGVYTELFRDVAFRLAPVDRKEAERMVAETRASRLIEGFRGPALAGSALLDVLVAVSNLMHTVPELLELDINPFLLDSRGGIAADALITLAE